jgi:putative oxidoreductase
MTAFGFLLIRLVTGGLLVGHGAQKLFGAFGGKGLEGTGRYFESLGIRPGRPWARVAGAAELGGGGLTALGFGSPLGPIIASAPMITAWRTAHRGKPIWASSGGAELPATNLAVLSAVALAGPGALSLDRMLGVRVPWWISMVATGAAATGILVALGDQIHQAAEELRQQESREAIAAAEEIPAAR